MPRPASQARKAKKRPKGFFKKSAGKRPRWAKKLDVGMEGVLLTCNRDERQCTREAYELLNEYADELYGSAVTGSCEGFESDEGDIADALEKEVSEMNEQREKKTMRFQARDSGAKNVIFIRTNINDDPANFVLHIVKKLKELGQCKSQHIQRILPVSMTCRANLEQIEKALKTLLEPVFHSADAKDSTFSVLFKARNNNEIQKPELVTVVANSVTAGATCKHTVDLDNPDYYILVEIICNVCCLSILKDYNLLRKYNVRALGGEPMNMPRREQTNHGGGGEGVAKDRNVQMEGAQVKGANDQNGAEQKTAGISRAGLGGPREQVTTVDIGGQGVAEQKTGETSAGGPEKPAEQEKMAKTDENGAGGSVVETAPKSGEQDSGKVAAKPADPSEAEKVAEPDLSKVDDSAEIPGESEEPDESGSTKEGGGGGAGEAGGASGGIRIF